MKAALGFAAFWNEAGEQLRNAESALIRALAYFPDIAQRQIAIGETKLLLWGRCDLDECMHTLPDGSTLVLIGTPVGDSSWEKIEKTLSDGSDLSAFRLPWDGRVILLRIDPHGKTWMLWNDWLGSIPIFYSASRQCRVAGTLEPVVVAANAFRGEDIHLPGLLLLLTHGNYLSDWTLFKDMHTLAPDSLTIMDDRGCRSDACHTIAATDERWANGWDELVEEMHELVESAIHQTLQTQSKWILPLSSGLDSRLIAVVGAAAGCDLSAYTWGPSTTRDAVYSRQIARTLDLPWQRIDLGENYLERYLPAWVDLFGSAMHFHGMYQMPFLEALRSVPQAPIVSGYIGECLAGYDVHFQSDFHRSAGRQYYSHPVVYLHWRVDDLKKLFRFPIDAALEEIADLIETEKNTVSGPWFQRLRFSTIWGRQNHFTYFQSMLSDYYRGVATPYLNRAYARFCMSLPRAVLDDRRLQIDMMRRNYAKVMTISGTYAPEPAILTGRYLLKRRIAGSLPQAWASRLFPQFSVVKHIKTDINSLRACGRNAIWPIPQKSTSLAEWVDLDQVENTYAEALGGDDRAVKKLQSLQTFAYRLADPL